MNTIWKFAIAPGEQVVAMPKGSKIIHAAAMFGGLFLWAEVDSEAPLVNRLIEAAGTGHARDDSTPTYVGTATDHALVWHVYDHGEATNQ